MARRQIHGADRRYLSHKIVSLLGCTLDFSHSLSALSRLEFEFGVEDTIPPVDLINKLKTLDQRKK